MLGAAAAGIGRGLAPFLQHIIGLWFVAQHDLQPEVSREARNGMIAAFPGEKMLSALTLYQNQACPLPRYDLGQWL